jgi:beta-lactamase superfamily II metal-dependent hydrolase
MVISRVVTVVVDVGQGQCTFAVLFDGNTIAHTLLFDCGSDKTSPSTPGNISSIADMLLKMNTPTIDLLVLSHSDSDHISLMKGLLDLIDDPVDLTKPRKLKILRLWYGGDAADFVKKTNAFDIIEYLRKYYKPIISWPDFNQSQYDNSLHDFKAPAMWVSPDNTVFVSMLIGNVVDSKPGKFKHTTFPKNKKGESPDKNGVSIVCALVHAGCSLIICGDATNRSMAWINYYFEPDIFPKTVLMLTLPHHGSRATSLPGSQNAITVVENFATVANARTITASAFDDFGHPSIELMNYFTPITWPKAVLKDIRVTDNSHFAVCNVDLDLKLSTQVNLKQANYLTLTSEKNVFTTYYFKPTAVFSYQFKPKDLGVGPPPIFNPTNLNPHACWAYTTDGKGGGMVQGYDKMLGTLFTSPVSVLAALPGTVTTDAFFAGEDRRPPHPSLPEPKAVPVGWVARAPASATRALAAASLGRLRTFR